MANGQQSTPPASNQGTIERKVDVCINDVLPKELVLRIFSFMDIETLCTCSQVCKFWYKCAFDGSIWKRTNLFNFQRDVQPEVVEKIALRCRGFLRELILRGCRNINDDAIGRFTELCRLIEILDLSECQHLTDETCKYLGVNCPDLQQLSLASCQLITDDGLSRLRTCSFLTHLDVSWCAVGDDGLAAIAQGCGGLKELKLVGCHDVSSHGIGHIASRAPGLLLLNLSHCTQNITDEALIHLAMGCPSLRALSVSLCPISDIGLRALAGTLPSSTAADLLGLALPAPPPSAPPTNGAGPPPLLIVPGQRGTRGNRPVSESHHQHVQHHHVGGGQGGGGFFASNGHGHRQSPRTAPNSPTGWMLEGGQQQPKPIIVAGCRELKVVEASQCVHITDAGLAALARNCVKLEKLDLEYCSQVTDVTLGHLASHCPRLNTLVLSHCDQVTDEGVSRLVGGLCGPQQLQRLVMDNCPLLTDSSLEVLGSVCHNLRAVDLYDCQLITRQGIENLKEQNPRLQIKAFFAPGTPPESAIGRRRRYCRCCALL